MLIAASVAFAQAEAPQAIRPGAVRMLPLTKFYDTEGAPSGSPGKLVRSEATFDYLLSPEIRTVRILYGSRSGSGANVYASGVVLYPDRAAPARGWPVLAWAHPFIGLARSCAPSLAANLYAGSYLSMYVKLGYAVVATDYAGLGTPFPSPSVDMRSNANDVVYAVSAARAAVPQLGRRWVALGDSEGGLAALGVADLESEIRDSQYLGAIAISPPVNPESWYAPAETTDGTRFLVLAHSIKAAFPKFQPSDILSAKGVAQYARIATSCAPMVQGRPSELLKSNWAGNEFVRQFFARNRPGGKLLFGPLLVITSEADRENPVVDVAQAVERMCKQGSRVQFHRDQEPNPESVLGDSVQDQIAWMEARFAGASPPADCH